MGLIDGAVQAALTELRKALGVAERETEDVLPVRDIEDIQTHVLSGVEAIKEATEQIASHAAAVETLVATLPTLTAAVQEMTKQLGVIADVLEPIVGAEHEVSKLSQLLGRHRHQEPASPSVPSEAPPTLHG